MTDRLLPRFRNLSANYAIPNPNLEFATLCLSNALLIAREMTGNFPEAQAKLPTSPGGHIAIEMVCEVKWMALANLSYCGICLGDFSTALKHATEILEDPICAYRTYK